MSEIQTIQTARAGTTLQQAGIILSYYNLDVRHKIIPPETILASYASRFTFEVCEERSTIN